MSWAAGMHKGGWIADWASYQSLESGGAELWVINASCISWVAELVTMQIDWVEVVINRPNLVISVGDCLLLHWNMSLLGSLPTMYLGLQHTYILRLARVNSTIQRLLNWVHKQFIDGGSMVWDHSHSTRETSIVETQAREQATSKRWVTHWAAHWATQ